MLRNPVVLASSVPMFGKKVPQAHGDHPVRLRQRPEHGIPAAEIAERAMHADERCSLAEREIGQSYPLKRRACMLGLPGWNRL